MSRRYRLVTRNNGGGAPFRYISISNFGIQEYMRHTKETDEVFPHGYYFRDGYLHPANSPAWEWTMTTNWLRSFLMNARIYP
jgi:hypothetical protein